MNRSSAHLLSSLLTAGFLLVCVDSTSLAQKIWTGGGGGDDNWTTDANWDGVAPTDPYAGNIILNNTDLGNVNDVDADWTINGLWYSNSIAGQSHTTDLGGNTLVVRNGIWCGAHPYLGASSTIDRSGTANAEATVQNGSIQLGAGATAADILVGYHYQYGGYPGGTFLPTNSALTITGTLNCTNVNKIYLGGRDYACNSYGEGTLDLSGATISSPGKADTLKAATLHVGRGAYYSAAGIGTLMLPASLKSLEVTGALYVGYGYRRSVAPYVFSEGTIDFGAGSILTNLSVGGDFYLCTQSARFGRLLNFPSSASVQIGSSGSPAKMHMGQTTYVAVMTNFAALTLTGNFTAYLSELLIANGNVYPDGACTGVLDLSQANVQIGDEPNKVKGLSLLQVGYQTRAVGTLRLPSNITEISVGSLFLGQGSGYNKAQGFLDIGSNSQLNVLTATNGFYMSVKDGTGRIGYEGVGGFVDELPAGLAFTVGRPTANVPMQLAMSRGGSAMPATGTLSVVNGSFLGYLSELQIGYNPAYYGNNIGLLDLSSSSVQIGDEADKVKIAKLIIAGGGNDSIYGGGGQQSTLRLPPDVTDIVVGTIELGVGGGPYTARPNEATLDLGTGSALQSFSVTNSFFMGCYAAKFGRILGLPASGLTMTIGQASKRIPMYMGYKAVKNYDESRLPIGEAILRMTNATLSVYLTDLVLGVCDNTGLWGGGDAELTLDGGSLAAFDVSGSIRIGQSSNTFAGKAQGYLNLPTGNATTGNLLLGGTNASFSSGQVKLHSTQFAVTNSLVIDLTGRLTNDMAGVSGGIDVISTDTNDFLINAGGIMHLLYDQDPDDPKETYWSLRMTGDQIEHFQWLNDQGRLTWDASGMAASHLPRLGIHYSAYQDKTYVGLREMGGTLIMLN